MIVSLLRISDRTAVGFGAGPATKKGTKRKATAKKGVASVHKTPAKQTPQTNDSISLSKEKESLVKARDDAAVTSIKINRAPVLTLWVKLVAERQGLVTYSSTSSNESIVTSHSQYNTMVIT